MADVRITQYPQKIVVADNDIFLIADSNDVDVNGFLKYKKVRAKDLPSIVNTAENITYANLMASIAANDLIIGTFYRITDSTSGVSPLLVQAVGVNAISYQAFDGANPLNTINYNVATDTIRWNKNQTNPPQDYLSGSGIVKSTAGTISYLADNSTNWNTAFNNSIVSAAVTGSATKTLTLNQQDGGTVTASWSDIDTGLTSVGLSMPSAFTVSNSPLTANGTLAVTGAGVASQYVRGDGTLASFPTSTGGGSSVSYYFNGGTNQGVIGGNTYYEMSETAVIGVGADFNINANGYIAQFVTDANDPALLNIPAGNWNFEMWFSASSGGGSPSFYLELYKYDGTTLTLISSGSAVPEAITGGTAIDLYTTALAVPSTALTITDRLAVRVFVNNSSRTITLHTQNGHLCQAITTFSTGLTALNGLTNQVQYLTTGTSGTDFAISSTTDTHTFNLPTASATNRGALSSADWSTFSAKIGGSGTTNFLPKFTGASALGNSLFQETTNAIGLGITPSAWSGFKALEIGAVGNSLWSAGSNDIRLNTNYVFDVSGKYAGTGFATQYQQTVGQHRWFTAPSGTAGNAITFTQAMTLDASGNLAIGTTTPATKLDVVGSVADTAVVGGITVEQTTLFRPSNSAGGLRTGFNTTGGDVYLWSSTSGANLNFGTRVAPNNNVGMTLLSGGNLGIGTATPTFKLDVVGTARVSSDATINGVTVGKGAGSIATNTAVGFEAINSNVSATGVTALGYQALRASTGGSNTGVGYQALLVNSTATQNTAVGFLSLAATTTGASNTAVGSQALTANITGANNTAVGRGSLQANTASNNTAIGFEAANANTSGTNITAIGYQSLKANTTGTSNTAVGNSALLTNIVGTDNTAVGTGSLQLNLADYNTAIGTSSLTANTAGFRNTAIGRSALTTNTLGNYNTAIGMFALQSNTTSSNNTAIGYDSLKNNTAANNVAVGFEAASSNTSGTNITAIGYQALKASTGANNTALGFTALAANTTGIQNTALGSQSLQKNTTGISNIGIGLSALLNNLVGNSNIAIGVESLLNSTGNNNIAIGTSALSLNTAANNVAVGFEAANANTSGNEITALGYQSLKANTTGVSNTAFGSTALSANITGNANTAIGSNAMNANTTGSNNNVIGYNQVCTNFSGVSMIGRSDTATGSNQMRFGSAAINNGAVATEVVVSDRTWAVFINGVAYKILLKA